MHTHVLGSSLWAFLLVLLLGTAVVNAQRTGTRGSTVPDVWPLNAEEVQSFWEHFRNQRPTENYVFEFSLKHMPRRGAGAEFDGLLWGGVTDQGPVSRVWIRQRGSDEPPLEFLVYNGPTTRLWRWSAADGVHEVAAEESLQPLHPLILYSLFDISMPFLYWPDYRYLHSERLRGRGAHLFRLSPPAELDLGDIVAVEVAVDAQFNALLRAQALDETETPVRSFNMLNFRRVSGQWIVRTIDLIDEMSRDKTRFEINAAAFNLVFPPAFFTPEALGGQRPLLDEHLLERF